MMVNTKYMRENMTVYVVIFTLFLFADSTNTSASYDCPMIDCVRPCPDNMYIIDDNGCQTCDCECPMRKCVPCKSNRYAIDEYGCQSCECECPMIDCVRPCPDSVYVIDEDGCQTCDCECPLVSCVPCPNGKYGKDEYGCQNCDCVDSASSLISCVTLILAGTVIFCILLYLFIQHRSRAVYCLPGHHSPPSTKVEKIQPVMHEVKISEKNITVY